MKFMVQYNLINEDQLLKIKKGIDKYPHEYVSVLPFSHEIKADEPLQGTDYIPYGSTLFISLSHELKWRGCYFDLNTFHYGAFSKNRKDMLNGNVLTVKEALEYLKTQPKDKMWFTRPSKDLKQFTGVVNSSESCLEYFTNALAADTSSIAQLKPETEIVLSIPQNLESEYRWFVVNRKVVSGSSYRREGLMYTELVTDPKMIAEAQSFADDWLPHENCVMDLASVDGKMKVIEFNCLNGSGLYRNDVDAIFGAIWEYEKGKTQ